MTDDRDAFDQAVRYLEFGQSDLAIPLLQTYLASHPDDPFAHAQLAQAYVGIREYALARESATHSIAHLPDNDHPFRLLALAHSRLGDADAARAAAERAQAIAPHDWRTHLVRAQADVIADKATPRGREAVAELLREEPERLQTQLIAADYVRTEGPLLFASDRDKVRGHLEAALAIDPENSDAMAGLGLLESKSRWRGALSSQLMVGAAALDPASPANAAQFFIAIWASFKWLPRFYLVLFVFVLLIGSPDDVTPADESQRAYFGAALIGAICGLLLAVAFLGRLLLTLRSRTWSFLRAARHSSGWLTAWLFAIALSLAVLLALPALNFSIALIVIPIAFVCLSVTTVVLWLIRFSMTHYVPPTPAEKASKN